jgi:AraC family transcriptional regulator
MQYSPNATAGSVAIEETNLVPSLIELLDGARKEFDADREAAKALLNRASSLLRVEADRQATEIAPETRTGGLVAWQIRRLNVYIEARLDRPVLLKDLSALSKLSTAYFCRAFKRTFDETPHAHLVRRRLERAETLMLTGDLSLSDIALRCGFSDQAHLCKLFRRQYDQTPATWRRERTEAANRQPAGAPSSRASGKPALETC